MINQHWKNLENLIIVAGHAVYTADNFKNPFDDNNWFLLPFQKGEPPFYIEHIYKGVELTDRDPKSLLVFSGGQTRYEAGPRSEAYSYWSIADHYHWFWKSNVKLRAITEEFARDSFENLLFSICRFREVVGKYPMSVNVVSWAFKESRFDLHKNAIHLSNYEFTGVNNPIDLDGAKKGEADAKADFTTDPYGTKTNDDKIEVTSKIKKFLGDKRNDRNPFNRQHPYSITCDEIRDLLQYKGTVTYQGKLPWK